MQTLKNVTLSIIITLVLTSCGFHLRGYSGNYQLPYKTIHLDCGTPAICPGLVSAINNQQLTKIVSTNESAEVNIVISGEQTSRDALDYNQFGRIASYLLTYQISAQIYDSQNQQIGDDIIINKQLSFLYNDSLILSANQQEIALWDQLHQSVINQLLNRLIYVRPNLAVTNDAAKSK